MSYGMQELRRENEDRKQFIWCLLKAANDNLDEAASAENDTNLRNLLSSIIHDINEISKEYKNGK